MNWSLIFGVGIPTLFVFLITRYTYRTYNEIIWWGLKVDKLVGNVEATLKKKYDMIPALSEVVKGYAKHESSTFSEVTKLRSQWGATKNTNDKIKISNQLEGALSKLLLIQEQYPKLKADRNFRDIQRSISRVDNDIMKERKYYNEKVRRYNVRVKLFPKNIIAKMFGFKEREFFSRE
ncbi:LemA family protein [Patescibacteria group bacterium]|nr:LemA family protein [Patescibacteria group bacterium]